MGGRAPRVPPGGYKRPPSRIPPAGGGGVARARYSPGGPLAGPPARVLREANGAEVWLDAAGEVVHITGTWPAPTSAPPAYPQTRPHYVGRQGDGTCPVCRQIAPCGRQHTAEQITAGEAAAKLAHLQRQVADGLFAGTGGLLDPQARLQQHIADRGFVRVAGEARSLPPTRIGRWSAYVVGVPLVLLATGSVGRLLGAADWAVLVVSTLLVLAGVLAVAIPVGRRRYRRQIEVERRALAERADRENQEWMNR